MQKLRTLIVDDEPLARRRLELLLSDLEVVDVVGSAGSCAEGVAALRRLEPDLLLLDIQMRDGTGFDLLEAMQADRPPIVIFVTAFDSFAARAFDAAALDYVLKPIESERLARAIDRAASHRAERDASSRAAELGAALDALRGNIGPSSERYDTEFWVRRNGSGLVRIPVDQIEYITAEVDYVRLHLPGHSYLARDTLASLQERLDPKHFIRVHRSSIVRISAVKEIRRSPVGAVEVHLSNRVKLRVGRAFNRALRDLVQTT